MAVRRHGAAEGRMWIAKRGHAEDTHATEPARSRIAPTWNEKNPFRSPPTIRYEASVGPTEQRHGKDLDPIRDAPGMEVGCGLILNCFRVFSGIGNKSR